MRNFLTISSLLFIFLNSNFLVAQKKVEPPKTTRILFILDASGSMNEKWEGNTRMNVAKDILSKLVDSLKSEKNLELALRVYGHEWDKRYNNCKDTKLEVPFRPGNHDNIKHRIKTIEAKGTTLISYSLEKCASDFPDDKNSRNVIVLLTDGIESCGGDPCALSLALQKRNIFLKPFIIGIGADASFEKAFSCMGQYYDAADVNTFKTTMSKIIVQALKETQVKVNLLNIDNKPTETNVNITFINSFTNEISYDFVHFLDEHGKPDNLKVDAILTYDIIVNTIPKVIKKGVYFEGGKENIVNIKTPQGTLFIKDNHKEYKNLSAIVKQSGQEGTINVQKAGNKEKYLVGTYDIEVLTLPRTNFQNVKIDQSKTYTIKIDQPGTLNIPENFPGYGSIYEIKSNGDHNWIFNLEDENSKTFLTLQPGNYKLVFRSSKSHGSEYTDVQKFTIRSGSTTTLKLFNR